jgi:hypothetical protein
VTKASRKLTLYPYSMETCFAGARGVIVPLRSTFSQFPKLGLANGIKPDLTPRSAVRNACGRTRPGPLGWSTSVSQRHADLQTWKGPEGLFQRPDKKCGCNSSWISALRTNLFNQSWSVVCLFAPSLILSLTRRPNN